MMTYKREKIEEIFFFTRTYVSAELGNAKLEGFFLKLHKKLFISKKKKIRELGEYRNIFPDASKGNYTTGIGS